MDFPIPPESWWSTDILSSSNFLQGVDQQILPCGQGRIDSVKINPSLLMMRECSMLMHCSSGILQQCSAPFAGDFIIKTAIEVGALFASVRIKSSYIGCYMIPN